MLLFDFVLQMFGNDTEKIFVKDRRKQKAKLLMFYRRGVRIGNWEFVLVFFIGDNNKTYTAKEKKMKKPIKRIGVAVLASCMAFGVLSNFGLRGVEAAGNTVEVYEGDDIAAVINKAAAGTTIYVHAGNYKYKSAISIKNNDISVICEEGTVLNGTGVNVTSSNESMVKIYGDNVTIDNLDVTGLKTNSYKVVPTGYRVCAGADHVTIKNCEVSDIGCIYENKSNIKKYNAHGIIVSGEIASAITDVTIDNCYVHGLTLGQSESLVLNGNVDDFKVINNLVENNDNIGIDLIGYEKQDDDYSEEENELDRARNGLVENNVVRNISSGSNPTYKDSKCAGGIYVDGGTTIEIKNNYVENSDIGIEVASEHEGKITDNITVTNNTFVKNQGFNGISIGGCDKENGYAGDCIFTKNIVYNEANHCFNFQQIKNTNVITDNVFIDTASDVYEKESACSSDALKKTKISNFISRKTSFATKDTVFNVKYVDIDSDNCTITINSDKKFDGYGAKIDFSKNTLGKTVKEDEKPVDNYEENDTEDNTEAEVDENDTEDEEMVEPTYKISAPSFYTVKDLSDGSKQFTFKKTGSTNWKHITVDFNDVDLERYNKVYITVVASRKDLYLGITNKDEDDPIFYRNHWKSSSKVGTTKEVTIEIDLTEDNLDGLYIYCDATSSSTYKKSQKLTIKSIRFDKK